jgi:DNA-binding response OmpR family regulator
VLVVDDEPIIGEVVSRYLNRAGYETRVACDGPQALQMAAAYRPDLVVLDVMLPGLGGLEVMSRLRESARERTAVVLLTARGREADRIAGLRLGADDYVVKPFSPAELVARVDAVLRRAEPPKDETAPPLVFEGLEIQPATRRVFVDGAEVALTHLEFELLFFLAHHPGQVFTRDHLMDTVWDGVYRDPTTVTVHVRRLRAKIEADPSEPRRLQTVWGVGYRLQP